MRRVSGIDYARSDRETKTRASSRRGRELDSTVQADAVESWMTQRSMRRSSDFGAASFKGSKTDARQSDERWPDRWLGTIVDNRYRVVEVVGRGGMGVVYRVEHLRMGKIAAMKVLHHDLEREAEVSRRFRIEAEAVSRLTHPNTVAVFDFGMAKGALYLVMEYVRGLDIGTIIDRDGPLSLSRAAPLFGQVAAALAEAHELGVIHRDLKPENILVTRTHGGHDFVKVLDFGLAKLAEREELSESTGRGAIVGTPYYMSPEQIRADDIDARADIYSLGALMYRVLTGEPPYRAKTPVGVLTKHLTEPLIPPSKRRPDLELPKAIDRIIGKAMEKDRDNRYDAIDELSAELAEVYHTHRASSRRGQRASGASVAWHFPGASSGRLGTAADDVGKNDYGIDYGIDTGMRLRRSDLDRYERSLRRRHWLRLLLFPLLVAAAIGGVFYYLTYVEGQPLTAEVEPNSSLGKSNLVAINSNVRGQLGKRTSPSEADKDFFKVDPGSNRVISVWTTAPPNIDLALFVYDLNGKMLRYANEAPEGKPEAIEALTVDGPFVVMVTEAREAGDETMPTENVSDSYAIVIRSGPTSGIAEAAEAKAKAEEAQ